MHYCEVCALGELKAGELSVRLFSRDGFIIDEYPVIHRLIVCLSIDSSAANLHSEIHFELNFSIVGHSRPKCMNDAALLLNGTTIGKHLWHRYAESL